MTPRWTLEGPEGRRLSTKMPPLRGSLRFQAAQAGISGNNPEICRTPTDDTDDE